MRETLLTVPDIIEYLQISRSTWDKWRQNGTAPRAIRLPNGTLRVRESDFAAWLEQAQLAGVL